MKDSSINHTLLVIFFTLTSSALFAQSDQKFSLDDDTKKVKALLKRIDADVSDTSVYSNEVVHMAQGSRAITDKNELARVLSAEAAAGNLAMTHEIITINSYPDHVIVRGKVTGTFQSKEGGTVYPFETNNLMTFKRAKDGNLKIWHVIFNRIELERYQKK